MATPKEKLASSLEVLHELQKKNDLVAIRTSDLNRTHRERLVKNGFLKEVTKGWYIGTNPMEKSGESTSWYTSYWKFCAQYLKQKYGEDYCISAEQSLLVNSGNKNIPPQLVVRALKSSNTNVNFIYDTSLFAMQSSLPANAEIVEIEGLRMLTLPSSLVNCSPTMFEKNPTDVRTALAQVSDSSEILKLLLAGSHSLIAGRLAGAFRNIGRDRVADDIVKTMKAADFDVRETDPFKSKPTAVLSFREKSPYANRIRLMWYKYRGIIIKHFPESQGLPKDEKAYLKSVEEIYTTDAYHSLSIERYTVSVELIEKVRSGAWNLEGSQEDKEHKDAMAARGYWLSAQVVKKSIAKVLKGSNSGKAADYDHHDWYRELFAPSVTAGILEVSDLAGYRTNQVYISNSKYVPLNKDAVRDAMPVLFELLENEEHAGVRAVLGHFIFVYIHPYADGNGRMGRFLMNVMLASGGYPWTVIPVEERDSYMQALEKASVDNDIEPLAKFVSNLVNQCLKGSPVARL